PMDFATAARLASAIDDAGLATRMQATVCDHLRVNLASPHLYSHAIEAFEYLGDAGLRLLDECLLPDDLSSAYAIDEAHLIGRARSEVMEEDTEAAWRLLGRSVYLVGEMGAVELASKITKHVDDILSVHLLYHVGEALLTLARIPGTSHKGQRLLIETARKLRTRRVQYKWMTRPQQDPVLRGYSYAVLTTCGEMPGRRSKVAENLAEFLIAQSNTNRDHFRNEFWSRAHGSEAYAEIATSDECVKVLDRLFQVEDNANYYDDPDNQPQGDYHQVQASLLKAALRSCDRSQNGKKWKPFLEQVFRSVRIDESAWACRHLERLLAKWFGGELEWIKRWSESNELGGERVRSTLQNVLWYFGT
ncbi:MAG TPA: hypothetical protein VFQ26_01615, partial [Nitrospiraceae bacterium]|nr:hypothetical protein [Nitrospiraceae bacterium]